MDKSRASAFDSRSVEPSKEELVLAPLSLRLVAHVVDGFLVSSFFRIGLFLVLPADTPHDDLMATLLHYLPIALFTYYGLLGSHLGKGQTLGKRMVGIAVVRSPGEYLPIPDSFLRGLIAAITPTAGGWVLIDPLCVFLSPRRRALHDWIADSHVVQLSGAPAMGSVVWKLVRIPLVIALLVGASLYFVPRSSEKQNELSPRTAGVSLEDRTPASQD